MKTLYILICFLLSLSAYSQKYVRYYDWAWKRTDDVGTARFVTVIEKKDSLWQRNDFFIRENSLQMSGSYTDTSCKVAQGHFNYYHSNKVPQYVGDYVNGKKQGVWLSYYRSGMMQDSAVYDNGNVTGTALSYYPNGYISDSSVYDTDGSGVSVEWFDNGVPAAAGRYAAGYKKMGKWQYFHKNGRTSAFEIYNQGRLADKQYFDEDGNSIADTTSRDREALFKGGPAAWLKFISNQLYFPQQYKITNADQAVVVVNATIDEDGKMTDVEVSVPFHKDFDAIAVRAMLKSPAWTPAIQHNRRVKYRITQAVTFQQEEY